MGILGILLFSNIACASWQNVYQDVKNAYIGEVKIQDVAVIALKGLKKIDGDLNVGNGVKSISLYYKGRIIDTVAKPDDDNDAEKWAEITKRFIRKAVEQSPIAQEKDFMIFDALAEEIPGVLDRDSKFFRSFDEAHGINVKNKRTFTARVKDNVLIVKIVAFNKQTLAELTKVGEENEKVDALVLDLRGCFGGVSSEAVLVADLFLDSGIILQVSGKNENEAVFYNANENVIWKNKPLFILTDGNTASAAEILTASLKEQGVAKVVGTTTKGKGTMQKLIGLKSGSVLAVTNNMFYTPSSNEINEKGVVPDICTFEVSEGQNIDKLIDKKQIWCYAESRENSEIEYKIVQNLLKKSINGK